MKRKVYMSVPLSLDWSTVQLFRRRFPEKEFEVNLWDRQRQNYNPRYFEDAEDVVFLLPNFTFNCPVSKLPTGVARELREAVEENKNIYVGYITATGDYNIYKGTILSGDITGVKGTANSIFKGTSASPSINFCNFDEYEASIDSSGSVVSNLYASKIKICTSMEQGGSDSRLLLMLQ